MPDQQKTCGDCAHWHKGPADPNNLAKPVMGECRGAPPQMITAQRGGRVLVEVQYPDLPPDFNACGLFKAREQPTLQKLAQAGWKEGMG